MMRRAQKASAHYSSPYSWPRRQRSSSVKAAEMVLRAERVELSLIDRHRFAKLVKPDPIGLDEMKEG